MDRNELVFSVQDLIYKMAADFDAKGLVGDNKAITKDDLIQSGFEAALKAAEQFEPDRGIKFITYAYSGIYRHMEQEVRRLGGPMTLPHIRMHYVIAEVADARSKWAQKYGEEPSLEELYDNEILLQKIRARKDYADIPQETLEGHIRNAVQYLENSQAISFEVAEEGEAEPLEDTYADESPWADPVQMYEEQELIDQVIEALNYLPDNERIVLSYRLGIEDGRHWTLREVAKKMSVSHEAVRKWEHSGLQTLRRLPIRFRLKELL